MIIDLTHTIRDSLPVYPGDSETRLIQSKQFANDHYNVFDLTMSMHAGTHIDGPMHLLDREEYIEEFPLEAFIGDGVLLNVCQQEVIEYREEYEAIVRENSIV